LVGAGRATDIVEFTAMELFVDAKTVLGCVYGSADPERDFPRLVELYRSGQLALDRLVTRRIALDEVNDAFRAMEPREVAGFVIGSVATHDGTCRELATAAGTAVASVEYRLAPEHPFPAAADDCAAATAWLHEHGRDVGIDPQRLAVAGDSAGGNLAAVVAL